MCKENQNFSEESNVKKCDGNCEECCPLVEYLRTSDELAKDMFQGIVERQTAINAVIYEASNVLATDVDDPEVFISNICYLVDKLSDTDDIALDLLDYIIEGEEMVCEEYYEDLEDENVSE